MLEKTEPGGVPALKLGDPVDVEDEDLALLHQGVLGIAFVRGGGEGEDHENERKEVKKVAINRF